jgi:hydrogenase maturation protease
VLVVGFGNPLAGDDGLGLAVVAALRAAGLPPGLRAEEGDTDSLRLPALWRGEPQVWLVDAVLAERAPGERFVVEHEQLLALPQHHATAHWLSLPESLRWIAHTWPEMAAVRYRLWAVQPEVVGPAPALSPSATAAVPAVAAAIRQAYLGG